MYVFDMYLSIAVVFGVTAAALALHIGRNAVLWFAAGLLAGPLALVVVLLSPTSRSGVRATHLRSAGGRSTLRKS